MRLGIIFGGTSTEHEVSVVSATSVIKNINKEKYTIIPIYISKENEWYHILDQPEQIECYKIGQLPTNLEKIQNIVAYLKELDVVFPILHGAYGEDGTIQGLLKMLNIPFVGCEVLASSLCMDKFYTKKILKNANINVTPDINIQKKKEKFFYLDSSFYKKEVAIKDIIDLINQKLDFPVFVKPSASGSSIGVIEVKTESSLEDALAEASKYDNKILIEKKIIGKEVECAILIDKLSDIGEILAAEEFYTFDAKYQNQASKTIIPASLSEELRKEIQNIALRAFRSVDGKGLARIDFFIEDETNRIYLNEINTMPGFTEISMYPKLIENMGISYKELLDILIVNACER